MLVQRLEMGIILFTKRLFCNYHIYICTCHSLMESYSYKWVNFQSLLMKRVRKLLINSTPQERHLSSANPHSCFFLASNHPHDLVSNPPVDAPAPTNPPAQPARPSRRVYRSPVRSRLTRNSILLLSLSLSLQ